MEVLVSLAGNFQCRLRLSLPSTAHTVGAVNDGTALHSPQREEAAVKPAAGVFTAL